MQVVGRAVRVELEAAGGRACNEGRKQRGVELEAAGGEGTSVRVTLVFTPARVNATVSAVSRFHRDKKRAAGAHYGAELQGSMSVNGATVNDEPEEEGDMGLRYAQGPNGNLSDDLPD